LFLTSRIVVCLTLLLMAATILIVSSAAVAQTDPPATGDWTIGDNTTIENQTVRLRGNLTVSSGGQLFLRNVTLQVFSSVGVLHGIRVAANGTLDIADGDGNTSTQADRSVVMRGNPSYGYSFLVEDDASIRIHSSLISGMGERGGTGGVLVRSDKSNISHSTFINGDLYDLMLEGSNGSIVDSCNFYLSGDGIVLKDCINITIANSSLMFNDRAGLHIEDSNATRILNCVVSNNDRVGLWVVGGQDNRVDLTVISKNLRGLVLESTAWFVLATSIVNDTTFEGISISKGSNNISILHSEIFDCERSGLEADGVHGLNLLNSQFKRCKYFGMRILNGSRSLDIMSSGFYNNSYDGVHIERTRDIWMVSNYIAFNGYNGIFLVDSQNVTVNNERIRNNTYDGLNCDNVRDILIDFIVTSGNGYHGLNLKAGSTDINISEGNFGYNTRSGINLNSAYNVSLSGPTAWYNGGYGIWIEGGSTNISGDCIIRNNTAGALRIEYSNDIHLNDSTITQTDLPGLMIYALGATDVWITNSTVAGTARLLQSSNLSMVHCTFETVSPDVDTTSWLKYIELVRVEVLWPNLLPVSDAAVNATGNGGEVLARGLTGTEGITEVMMVLFRTFVGDSVSDQNPITFWARKSFEVARNETNITKASIVQIILEDDLPPIAVASDVHAELKVRASLNGTKSRDNGELVSWVWTFDDGVGTVLLEGRVVNWTFPVLGTFTGQLEVFDTVGLTNVTSFMIIVTDTISPVVETGDNVTIGQGEWVPVDGTDTTDNDSTLIATGTFVWRVVPETPGLDVRTFSGPITTIPFPDMGVYRVELNVTDQSGNWGVSTRWVNVLDTEAPLVDAGLDIEVDEGEEALLEPLMVTDNDPEFEANLTAWWHVTGPDTDVTMDGILLVFIAPRMGVFQATLHVTDAAGNEGTDSRLVTARDKLPPVVDIGTDLTVEVFEELTFDASGVTDNDPDFPNGANYLWRLSGPQMDETHQGDVITFTVPWVGDYVVALTVTDEAGNEGSASVSVTSLDSALPEFGDFTPTHLDTSETGDVTITFVITDVGTGLDTQVVEMRMRSPSDEPWTAWQRVSIKASMGIMNRIEETMMLQFPEGESTVQLRCWDQAGNGPVTSEEHPIKVNSRPVVVVLSPAEGADYGPFDEILLDASASSDLDGDELSFRWASDLDGILGTDASVRAPPLSEGTHRITVVVSDGVAGHDVLVEVSITVRPVPSTVDPDEGMPWWIIAVAMLLLAGFVFVLWDHMRKRQRPPVSDEADEWVESP
jgi:parallel beta-helix repeat protein